MPIYEYKCRKCESVAERIEGIHDGPMRKCPSCGGKVDRMMSPGAFVLKGSGWYSTDYGSKNHGPCAASTGSEPAPACAGCPKLD